MLEGNYVLFLKKSILIIYFELGSKCYKNLKTRESTDIFETSEMLGAIIPLYLLYSLYLGIFLTI